MAKPSLGVSAPASPFFTPASDQSTVSHLKVTVQFATPQKDGSLLLTVFSGNVAFGISIADLPGRPEYKMGDRLLLEYPKGQNPMTAPYSAIYHADQVSQVSQTTLLNRSTKMNELIPFNFENKTIRVVTDEKGEPQFVAKDVAEGLGYVWKGASGTIPHVPEEWRGVCSVQTPSGMQEMAVLTEQGLYFFLGRSDKPGALPMQKWIAGDVIPSIRKTGSYSVKGSSEMLPPSVLDQVGTVIQQQLAAMFQAELPRLVQSELARQQISVRCGVTAGQVWQLYKLDQLKNGPQKLSRLLTAFGCEIDGGGKSEQGGRTAKMFDPDKSDKAMKSGLLEHCQRYIRERTGQRQLFAVQQDK